MELPDIKVIVADAHDADGMGSALLAKLAFPEAEVRMVNYGAEQRAVEPEEGMLWLDMCPPEDRVDEFVEVGACVIDHHAKQKRLVDKFGRRGAYSDEPGVSAALLTFQELLAPDALNADEHELSNLHALEDYATLIGIRDTWQKSHKRWREACIQSNAVEFYGIEHWLKDAKRRVLPIPSHDELKVGEMLYDRRIALIKRLASEVIINKTPKGKRWGIIPANGKTTSDLAEYMRVHHDLHTLVTFFFVTDGDFLTIRYSLRSDEIDVGAVAVEAGGGGHRNASGFEAKCLFVTIQNPIEHITNKLRDE